MRLLIQKRRSIPVPHLPIVDVIISEIIQSYVEIVRALRTACLRVSLRPENKKNRMFRVEQVPIVEEYSLQFFFRNSLRYTKICGMNFCSVSV